MIYEEIYAKIGEMLNSHNRDQFQQAQALATMAVADRLDRLGTIMEHHEKTLAKVDVRLDGIGILWEAVATKWFDS